MSKVKAIVILLVVVIVVLLAFDVLGVVPLGIMPQISGGGYQAVFLSNGQVYFGKLLRQSSQYPTLREVYYLQITQPPQPILEGTTPPANINVVKLGGELHGPTDEMRINRDHILFIENLKSDSRVVQAIEQFKATNP